MAITPLPTAPSRSDPSDVFNTRADAWVAALPPWTDEVNTIAVEIDSDSTSASGSASSALISENAAAASAQTALSAPGTSATSSSNVSITVGSKTWITQPGKDFVIGMILLAADDADPSNNNMIGAITLYDNVSGFLTIDITVVKGSGIKSAWTISITGKPGVDGSANIVEDTTPQLGGQLDVNGFSFGDGTRELITFTEKVSAINNINVTNADTGFGPILSAVGDDPDIDLNISGKGTGNIKLDSSIVPGENFIGSSKGADIATEAFELSTMSKVRKIQSIASEDTLPQGIAFNTDGSKIFMIGNQNDSIYEYNLTTPFDLSSISVVQVSKSITSETTVPSDIAFNADGSKIYMVEEQNNSIHEYNLTTPFDLNSMSVVQVSKSVASEDDTPTGIAFNTDGSKIYMVGVQNGSIYEYNLTTPFDLNSISVEQVTVSVESEDVTPSGITFNKNGSKIYMIGSAGNRLNEYNLTTNFDLSTMTAVQVIILISPDDNEPNGVILNADGSKIYIVGSQNDSIYEYNLGESFNLRSMLSVDESNKFVGSEDSTPNGIAFNNDGSKIYMVGDQNNSIYEYDLTTNFDLSTMSTVQATESVSSEDINPSDLAFNNDGSKIYIVGVQNSSIYEYSLSTPFDLSTISVVQVTKSVSSEDVSPTGLSFNSDGSKIYIVGTGNASLYEYDLTTSFDLSTISTVKFTKDISSEDINPQGVTFNNDGLKVFVIGSSTDSIYEYDLGTSFDLSTISVVKIIKTFSPSIPRGVIFNNDGSKIYLVDRSSERIYEYLLSTTLLTVGEDGDYFDVVGQSGFSGLVVDPDRKVTLQFDTNLDIIVGSGITLNNDGNNYTTSVGDVITFQSTQEDVVVGTIARASGGSVVSPPLGTWNLIGSLEANNNTTLTITGLDDTYETYAIGVSRLRSVGNVALEFRIRTGTSAGVDSGASDYSYHTSIVTSGNSGYFAISNSSSDHIRAGVMSTSTDNYVSMILFLNRSNGADFVAISGVLCTAKSTLSAGGHIMGIRNAKTIVDRVQVLFDTGNIASGRFTIWGIAHE